MGTDVGKIPPTLPHRQKVSLLTHSWSFVYVVVMFVCVGPTAVISLYEEIYYGVLALLCRSQDPRLEAVPTHLMHSVRLSIMQEAQRALPAIHGKLPSHTYNSWLRALKARAVLTMSNVQPL